MNRFESYLRRKQVVTYNDIESPVSIVPTGIGQGTILGRLISNFHMNDIVEQLFFVKVSMTVYMQTIVFDIYPVITGTLSELRYRRILVVLNIGLSSIT